MESPTLRLYSSLVDLSRAASECDIAVTQGGVHTSATMLLSGVRLLICPEQLEQTLLAYRLHKSGLCQFVSFFSDANKVKERFDEAVQSADLREKCRGFCLKIRPIRFVCNGERDSADMPECCMSIDSKERISPDCLTVNPVEARLDVSSLCQLDCLLCPVAQKKGRSFVGRGVLPVADFVEFVDHNPQIQMIEIGNSGEVFLNPDLPDILRYAHDKGVTIRIAEGANLNDAADEALEALVKYSVSVLRVAIDGATQETYRIYRVGGDLRKVLKNVQRINEYKKRYKSGLPRLILQFIPFGHNEHEIDKIACMARAFGMEIRVQAQ